MGKLEQSEGVSGIALLDRLGNPQSIPTDNTLKTAAGGNPQAEFEYKKKIQSTFEKLRATQLSYIDPVPELGLDTLQIHDLVFAMPRDLTPPTVIRVDKNIINYKWHTLRTSDVQKVTSGHSTAKIYMSLYFVGLDAINKGLRKLLAIFNSLPFVYIENSFIRKNMVPADNEGGNMACSLLNISVRTESEMPNVLVADLALLWFNYKPFATDFWFRKSWESPLTVPRNSQSVYDQKILKVAGGPDILSENDIQIKEPILKKDQTSAWTPPVTLPQNSEPLRKMIDSAKGPVLQSMSNEIVISFREYKSVGGIDGGVYTTGALNDKLLRTIKTPHVNISGKNVLLRLHPEAADSFEQLAELFARKFSTHGRKRRIKLSSCYRTREMQLKLQQQVPNLASKGYSWHEVGLAFDIARIGMTREEYQWLINNGSNFGFINLGTSNSYSPKFTDDKQWNQSDTDANATIVPFTQSTGQASDWETWHFDYVPVQKRVRRQLGNGSTQVAIKTLRGMLHFTSVELDDKEIISEMGDEISLDKIRQRDTNAETKIREALKQDLIEGWEIDYFGSDATRVLLYKELELVIEDQDTRLIPQNITFAKSNIIAEIPILSHEFSTQQYMGSTDLDSAISFVAVGEAKLQALQIVVDTIQKNARIAKGVRDAAVVDIKNGILNFGGMTQAMVDKINVSSVPKKPGVYTVSLVLTQAKHKQKKDLNQERFIKLDAWRDASRWAVENLFVLQRSVIKDIRYLTKWDLVNQVVGEDADGNLNLQQKIEKLTNEEQENIEPGTLGIDNRQMLYFSLELLDRNIKKYVYDSSNLRRDKTQNKIHTGFTIEYLEGYDLYDTPIAEVLREYANIVAMILSEPFPRDLLYKLGLEGLSDVIIDSYENPDNQTAGPIVKPEQQNEWRRKSKAVAYVKSEKPLSNRWETILKHYRNRLQHLWVRIYNEGLYLHPVFGNLYTQMYDIFEQFKRGSECYPDLNLPANKLTGRTLDTPPDYWFWNTSVDGNMFSNHKEIAQTAAKFMANSYESMKEFVSEEEWNKNYISPNKSKIEKRTVGVDSTPKTKLAALVADEAGIGTVGKYKIPGEVIGQVFDEENGYLPPDLKGQTVEIGGNNQGAQITPDEDFESQPITDGYSGRLADMLEKSIQNFDSDVYRLARAYPTFKVYFMEEDSTDSGRLNIRNFDDFYSYSAIKDIRIVRSRKIPADLCVISITNIHGELDTLAYGGNEESSSSQVVEKFDPFKVNTDQENPFTKLVVMEGSKIQVRLGYDNAPENLDIVFTGQVVEVGVSPISPDIMQLVCQSYGTELVAKLKTGGKYSSTSELLSALMCSEECFHFGRYSHNSVYDPAEVRSATQGDSRVGLLGLNQAIDALKESFLKQNNFLNKPQDDNIFSPEYGDYEEWGEKVLDFFSVTGASQALEWLRIVDDDRVYYPWRATIWDIFKEMELRHPGYIAAPVPYGDRYTMFFGNPSHKYWSRPLSEIERGGWGYIESFLQGLQGKTLMHDALAAMLRTQATFPERLLKDPAARERMNKLKNLRDDHITDLYGQETNFAVAYKQFNEYLKWLVKGRAERYKPFRQYHFLSSENNIIANNLKASAHGTYNGVALTYMKKQIPKSNVETEQQANAEIQRVLAPVEMVFGVEAERAETLKLKADDNIEDHKTRMMEALYTSCVDEYFGRRYAVGLLMRSLKDVYKGTITITGSPKIKPHDVCLKGDTLILTNKGYKEIKDITTSDYVYTHKGVLRRVIQCFKRKPREQIFKLQCRTDPEPLIGTTNHPILSVKRADVFDDKRPWLGRCKDFVPTFRPLGNLKEKDYIACPRIKTKRKLHPSLAKLLGYYLAEGSIIWEYRKSFNKRYGKQKYDISPVKCHKVPVGINWDFNSETEYFMIKEINRLLAEIGINKTVCAYESIDKHGHKIKNGLRIILYDRDLTSFMLKEAGFSDAGGKREYLENKWLRSFFDEETTKNILGAYYNGDGCCDYKKNQGSLRAATTSMNLGRCIRQMLINIGIPAMSSIQYYENGAGYSTEPHWAYYNTIGKYYAQKILPYTWYDIDISLKMKKSSSTALVDELYVYIPIKEITQDNLDYVYNIGVEVDNSYVAAGKVVHNCILFDTYRDIYGPVEVEQVTHILSQETGFITEIKPDLMITHNSATTQATSDAMTHALAQFYNEVSDHIGDVAAATTTAIGAAAVGLGAGVVTGGIGLGLLVLGGYKMVEWSQERQPIIITPVMNGIKPIIAGLDGYKRDNLWQSVEGRWSKFKDNIDEGLQDWKQRSPISSWWSKKLSDHYQPGYE